jgi:hypothetical protein
MKNRSWFRQWSVVLTRVATPLGLVSLATRVWPGRSSSTAELTAGSSTVDASLSHGTPGLITGAIIITAALATVLWMRARGQGNRTTLRWLSSHKDHHPTPQDRHERLILACAALNGAISGAVQTIISWLLNHLAS